MSNIYLTSDWHLGHDREFIWKIRGFASVKDMNEAILQNHNSTVGDEDDVYVLGDLVLGDITNVDYIRRMKGKLHVVRGNHDTDARVTMYKMLPNIVEVENVIVFKYKKHHFYLSHYPTLTGNLENEHLKQMTLNLYGHTHQSTNFYMDMPYMFHVGCDSHNCTPVLLDNIIKEMYKKVEESKDFLDKEVSPEEIQTVLYAMEPQKAAVLNWQYEFEQCSKCVYEHTECPGPDLYSPGCCPEGHKYRRDPPDGGYYG